MSRLIADLTIMSLECFEELSQASQERWDEDALAREIYVAGK
jgi:hypothetical protein